MTGSGVARVGQWLCLGGAALGALGLLGWITGTPLLTVVVPGQPPMMPNTGLGLLLIGFAGALRHRADTGRAQRMLSMLAAGVVLAIGAGTLAEYALGIDLNIDQLLMASQLGPHPGRPSPPTALALTLLAASLLLLDSRASARARPSEWLALLAGLTAFTGLMGVVFGAGPLYRLPRAPVIGVALPTAISLLLTSLGLLLERPTAGLMRIATSPGPGGVLLRRFVVPAILAPVLLGVFATRLSAAVGVEELAIVVAILASTMALVGVVMLTLTAAPLNSTHDALVSSRSRTRSLVEQAPDGVFVADLDGRYIEVNAAGCQIVGYTRQEILGKTILDLISPEDADRLEQDRQLMLAGATQLGEWRLRRKDGSYVPVEVNARILSDGRWQGFVRDISERQSLEERAAVARERLTESEERFRLAIDEAPIGMALVALDGRFFRVNRALCEIVGYSAAELTGLTFHAITHPADLDADLALAGQLDRGEIPRYQLEKRYVRKDGTIVDIMLSGSIVRSHAGEPLYYIAQVEDITDRKRLEAEIRQSQERFELALKGADLAAWDWNVKTGEARFSARWAEMRGFNLEELRPHVTSWTSGVHPDDWPRVQNALTDYFEGRAPEYETEHRVRTKSGAWIWVLDRGKVFARDASGQPTRMVGTELEITERKRLAEALRLAEATSSGILSISADAIISIDEEQRITSFNNGAEEIFGHSKAEAIGAPLEMLIPERLRTIHRAHVERFAAGREIARRMGDRGAVISGLRKNGEEFPADAAISRLEVGGTRVLTVALRDITHQKRIEREQRFLAEVGAVLASSLDFEKTVAQFAELAVREIADVCIVDLVEEDGALHGLKVASRDPERQWACDVLARNVLDRERPHLVSAVFETHQQLLIAKVTAEAVASWGRDEEHLHALHVIDPRSLIAVPLLSRDKLLGVVVLISSMPSRLYGDSDLRLAEELARRAALSIENARLYRAAGRAIQARDDVLGVVAHDLRNPLWTILMQAALLKRSGPEPERRAQKPVQLIERATTRMNRLIQDLLDVTSMEAGRLSIERGRLQAGQIVVDAMEAQQPLAAASSLELRLDLAEDLPEVWADRDRMLQAFENLIGNAVKFTEPGGQILFGAAPRGDEVLFWVADTGTGIAAEDVPRLFDRFWQARRGGRRGAGLGLPIVKGIVEAHGGRIWVESAPGRGSTFFFTIPTANRADTWHPEPAPHGP